MRKSLTYLLVFILVLGTGGCNNPAERETEIYTDSEVPVAGPRPRRISLAASSGVFCDLAEKMREFSGNTIELLIYPDGALGNDGSIITGVRNGTVSMIIGSTSGQGSEVPELALLDIPYLFEDLEQCNQLLKGPLQEWFQPYYNQAGLQLISWRTSGYRMMTTNIPVLQAQDLQALTIRTMENSYHEAYWSALGAEVKEMGFSQVVYALQQGIINSQENPLSTILHSGVASVQEYVVKTDHLPFILAYVMNKELYDSLTPEEQDTLCRFFHELGDQFEKNAEEGRVNSLWECQETYGMEILEPGEELLAVMKEKNQVVIDLLKQNLGEARVNAYLELVEEAK